VPVDDPDGYVFTEELKADGGGKSEEGWKVQRPSVVDGS